ncbi:hypothetical protein D8Y22_00780 [Salinadaptatus halalkaliphilus]|uniref:Uncharacterized protein n=1 Tax=Salinadaptatus halalkaliphilus TaxID=2419781 RepID=A0A4S3TVI6_9EURY|nr:hypothetical protein [Salinadaptatus halalkaliphilus]THE66698.1 hypothetical protein D8Y22_00780 [Salinadaptatus halalkaliphilus]
MRLAHVTQLEDFGTRSLAVHGIMVLAFVNAILAGLFVGGQLGVVSFVALLNFTAGLWVAHSIHSLGNVTSDDDYSGVLNELFDTGEADSTDGFDSGRFGRLLALIAVVTGASLLTSAQALSEAVLSVAVVAVGAIAILTAGVGFMIALGASYDASEAQRLETMRQRGDAVETDGQHADDR